MGERLRMQKFSALIMILYIFFIHYNYIASICICNRSANLSSLSCISALLGSLAEHLFQCQISDVLLTFTIIGTIYDDSYWPVFKLLAIQFNKYFLR